MSETLIENKGFSVEMATLSAEICSTQHLLNGKLRRWDYHTLILIEIPD